MTPRSSTFAVAMLDTLNDARDELERIEYIDLLWLVADDVGRRIAQTWNLDPDRPEGWQ